MAPDRTESGLNIGTRFSGPSIQTRQRALLEVFAKLMTSRDRALVIVGPPGSGKSWFAHNFARDFATDFPGGIAFRSGTGGLDWDIPPTDPRAPKLLVFDALDESWPGERWPIDFIQQELSSNPMLRVLATSRELHDHPFDIYRLPEPTADEIAALIGTAAGFHGALPRSVVDLANGNPLFASTIGQIAREQGDLESAVQLLRPFERSGLVGPDGQALDARSSAGKRLVSSVREVDQQLMKMVQRDPDIVFDLDPRKFEEISAELFTRLGYSVTLTPTSKDGGKDLIVVQSTDLSSIMTFVECKRYARENPVGLEIVERLLGVVERGKATSGLILTTSTFTRGARQAADELRFRLSLKDYADFKDLLNKAMAGNR
jgi:restriction system protein